MNKFYKTESVVKEVLINEPITRVDNFILVYEVYRRIDKTITRLPFNNVMMLHKEYGLPSFETVVRCRRKIQKDYPELANDKIQKKRLEKTADYIEYNRQ